MSKRIADEYITKEHGSTSNVSDDRRVKMATAAQLAKRKLAAPKSRLNRANPGAPSPSLESPNPFANGGFSQQQSFQPPSSDGFGTNQSFPPANGTSNNGFKFSVPGNSNSFTFGQSFAAPASNPFDPMNVNSDPEVTASANGINTEDTVMESPQKKPVFGGFGSTKNNITGSNIFAGFGGQSSQASQPLNFGASQPQSNGFSTESSKPMFGQPLGNQSSSETTTSIFGQPLHNQVSSQPFGQSNSIFGQSAPGAVASSTAPASQPLFGFGQSTTAVATQSPSFSFAASPAPASPQPSHTPFSFGQTSQPAATSNAPPSSQPSTESARPLFGSAATTSSSPAPTSVFNSVQQKPTSNNPFASFGSQQPAATKTDAPTSQMPEAAAKNPFANLGGSGAKPSSEKPSSELSNGTTAKPLFNFPASSQPSMLFGAKPETSANPQETRSTPSSDALFKSSSSSSGATSAANTTSSSNNDSVISSQGLSGTVEKRDTGAQDRLSGLFSFGSNTPSKPVTQPSNLFSGFGTTSAPATNAAGNTPKFGSVVDSPSQKTTEPLLTASTKTLFGAPIANPQSGSSAFQGPAQTNEPAHSATKRTVHSNPPTSIPPWLDGDQYKSYDSNYRLHSLNREFQQRIASIDPVTTDFENIVRSYVAARESIGKSIGLYTRSIAGMKRKVDESSERLDEPQNNKRARATEEPTPTPQTVKSSTMSSIFQPVTSKPSSSSSNLFASMGQPQSSSVQNTAASSSKKSILPSEQRPSSASGQQPATSLFAGFSTSNESTSTKSKTSSADSTTPPSSPPKKAAPSTTGFQPATGGFKPAVAGFKPTTSAPSSGTDFLSAFSKSAQASSDKFAKAAREKRMAEEYDSEEDDLDAWTKKYEEEEKAKRAKVASASSQGFKPLLPSSNSSSSSENKLPVDSKSSSSSGSSEFKGFSDIPKTSADTIDQDNDAGDEQETSSENEDTNRSGDDEADLQEDEVDEQDEDAEEEEEEIVQLPPGESLFNRITRHPSPQKETKLSSPKKTSTPQFSFGSSTFGAGPAKTTPEAPSFSPITPATGSTFVPSKIFNFTPAPKDQPSPTPGASVFSGGFVRDGPIPGEGLFGSRSSTPVNGEKTASTPFAGFGASTSTPAADHTWKKGSEIKFGSSTADAPSVNITAATPPSVKPFGSLFGATTAPTNPSATPNTLGFNFGSSVSAPAPGFLGASSHLLPGSGISSAMSSRATSPGGTDNESVATDTEDTTNDPQASFTHTRPGEENEEVLFESRAKAMKSYTEEEVKGTKKQSPWNTEGTGEMRLLKNKETGKTRIVLRTDPGANIVVNTNLLPDVTYTGRAIGTNGGVQFPWFKEGGKPEKWLIKVKTAAIAKELATIMEANKGS